MQEVRFALRRLGRHRLATIGSTLTVRGAGIADAMAATWMPVERGT
jgi:hypothetical protein